VGSLYGISQAIGVYWFYAAVMGMILAGVSVSMIAAT
jgi:hypothetical protein